MASTNLIKSLSKAPASQPFTAEYVVNDTFNSAANGTKVKTRPGFAVFPPGETAVSDKLVINSGVAEWTGGGSDFTAPGSVIVGTDAGVKSVAVSLRLATLPDNPMTVYLASQSVSNGLRLYIYAGGTSVGLQYVVGGVVTDMTSLGTSVSVGDLIEAEIIFDAADQYPTSFSFKKNGVQTFSINQYDAEWTIVPYGTICGLGSWCTTGRTNEFTVTKRLQSPGTLYNASFEQAQAVAKGDSSVLSIHLVRLTPNVVNRVHVSIVKTAGLSGQSGEREFFIRAGSDGSALIEIPYKGITQGEQSVTISTPFASFTSKLHVMRFLGMTLTASAVQEDKVTAVLSFDGLPPKVSQLVPLSVVQTSGLAELNWDEVLIRADASGVATGWVGGFASGAGAQTLTVTACGSTFSAGCTVTALPSIASMPKISNPAAWGGSIPGAGATVVLPAGYMVWDSNTVPYNSVKLELIAARCTP